MIDRLADALTTSGFKVLAAAVNRIEGLAIAPDHAGLFETTLPAAIWPELAQLDRLTKDKLQAGDQNFREGRHDPSHPIWGIFGPDPRQYDPKQAKPLLDASVDWLVSQVRASH